MKTMSFSIDEMYLALVRRDSQFDGAFYAAIKTTGIFCRPSCTARKPLKENVVFYSTTRDCMAAGYRPCKRCRPLEASKAMPQWLAQLLDKLESRSGQRMTNRDVAELGVEPARASRWFEANHGVTFQKYLRLQRLTQALHQLSLGDDMLQVAYNAGYHSLSGFRDGFQKAFGINPGKASACKPPMLVNRLSTVLGPMVVAADEDQLYLLEFADRRQLKTQLERLAKRTERTLIPGESRLMEVVQLQLDEYFQQLRTEFNLPLAMVGSPFQLSVWKQLCGIPYGQTVSYEQIAVGIGCSRGHRAVGLANGDNRLAIVIPCHRVIRADGSLSGYGGSVWRKQWLLLHESGRD